MHKLVDLFAGKGIEKIADSQAWADLPPVNFDPKMPLNEAANPEQAPLPAETSTNLTDGHKKKILQDENFAGNWDEFITRQQERMSEIEESRIVQDAVDLRKDPAKLARIQAKFPSPPPLATATAYTPEPQPAASGYAWDLGDFIPVDFEVTEWEDLFPSLSKVLRPPSTSNIIFAKLMTYYYTRTGTASFAALS